MTRVKGGCTSSERHFRACLLSLREPGPKRGDASLVQREVNDEEGPQGVRKRESTRVVSYISKRGGGSASVPNPRWVHISGLGGKASFRYEMVIRNSPVVQTQTPLNIREREDLFQARGNIAGMKVTPRIAHVANDQFETEKKKDNRQNHHHHKNGGKKNNEGE